MKMITLYKLYPVGEAVVDEETGNATTIDIFDPERNAISHRTEKVTIKKQDIYISLGKINKQGTQEREDQQMADYFLKGEGKK